MSAKDIFLYEWLHFKRSPLKVLTLILFVAAAVYGLQNGLNLLSEQREEIAQMEAEREESVQQILDWLAAGKKGPEDRPYIDIHSLRWAFYYLPTWMWKEPSAMMVYSVGQAEQYGYYKKVTEWDTVFDNDLSEEIANPERLALGSLDFSFVITYLMPLLLIILLYNIKGYERDSAVLRLVKVQVVQLRTWVLARVAFYFVLVALTLSVLMLAYAFISDVLALDAAAFVQYLFFVISYLLLWCMAFGIVISLENGSMAKSLIMASLWLVFAVVLPATVQQLASTQFSSLYNTDFLDAKREEVYELYGHLYFLPEDSLKMELLKPELGLFETKVAKDSVFDRSVMSHTIPYLANRLTSAAAADLVAQSTEKNDFIQASYWFNPVSFFSNVLNALCETDYYAFLSFRNEIQEEIDQRSKIRVLDAWNQEEIDEDRLKYYMDLFGRNSQ